MGKNSKQIGMVLGILVFLILKFINLPGEISPEGQTCLALTLMVVVWWAFQIAQSGFTSGIYLALLAILGVAEPTVVFSAWTGTTMYLVIGAYLIADAVYPACPYRVQHFRYGGTLKIRTAPSVVGKLDYPCFVQYGDGRLSR